MLSSSDADHAGQQGEEDVTPALLGLTAPMGGRRGQVGRARAPARHRAEAALATPARPRRRRRTVRGYDRLTDRQLQPVGGLTVVGAARSSTERWRLKVPTESPRLPRGLGSNQRDNQDNTPRSRPELPTPRRHRSSAYPSLRDRSPRGARGVDPRHAVPRRPSPEARCSLGYKEASRSE